MTIGRPSHNAPRDIIQPNNNPDQENNFLERWDARKERIRAAKSLPADGHQRRIGRPRSISEETRDLIVRDCKESGNLTDIALKYRVDRATVRRILKARGVDTATLPKPRVNCEHKVECTTYIDPQLFGKIKTAAKLRDRSVAAEVRIALRRLYDV